MFWNLIFHCQNLFRGTLYIPNLDILGILSISWHVEENMIWQSAGYFFLISEQRFQTLMQKSLIWNPAMVSMTKTQLTIRQNVKKNRDLEISSFFQLRFGFICIPCYRSLNIGPRPCSLIQELHFSSKFNYIKQNLGGVNPYMKILKS